MGLTPSAFPRALAAGSPPSGFSIQLNWGNCFGRLGLPLSGLPNGIVDTKDDSHPNRLASFMI